MRRGSTVLTPRHGTRPEGPWTTGDSSLRDRDRGRLPFGLSEGEESLNRFVGVFLSVFTRYRDEGGSLPDKHYGILNRDEVVSRGLSRATGTVTNPFQRVRKSSLRERSTTVVLNGFVPGWDHRKG